MLDAGAEPGGQEHEQPAVPATTKPAAVTAVPAASSRRSPQRSASRPAGSWNRAMPPEYTVRMRPIRANVRPNSAAHTGRRT